jgi:hypothetical protein
MHSPPQLRLHFLELRPHVVAPALPLDLELAGAGFSAYLGDGSMHFKIPWLPLRSRGSLMDDSDGCSFGRHRACDGALLIHWL